MVKKEIRQLYSQKRVDVPAAELAELDGRIIENFRSVNLEGIQVLLSYYPIVARAEFNVALCEQLLQLNNPNLQIAWPRLQDDNITMEAIAVTKDTVLIKNRFSIFEPSGNNFLQPQLIDAVFVPLLAFDAKGYRVGYGKGYYDRFLARCAPDVVKIGFSYFEALPAIDDINEFDVPLKYCITPMRVYEF
jgi:5-formyltetrahydrofolate cyclo-ligase